MEQCGYEVFGIFSPSSNAPKFSASGEIIMQTETLFSGKIAGINVSGELEDRRIFIKLDHAQEDILLTQRSDGTWISGNIDFPSKGIHMHGRLSLQLFK